MSDRFPPFHGNVYGDVLHAIDINTRPDMTFAVDWMLTINCQVYLDIDTARLVSLRRAVRVTCIQVRVADGLRSLL